VQVLNLAGRQTPTVLNDGCPSFDRFPNFGGHRIKFLDNVLINKDNIPEISTASGRRKKPVDDRDIADSL